jgi:hypothetical protein
MKTNIVKFVFGAIVALAGFSAAVMLLWNVLVPEMFELTAIGFWQALGLFVLALPVCFLAISTEVTTESLTAYLKKIISRCRQALRKIRFLAFLSPQIR